MAAPELQAVKQSPPPLPTRESPAKRCGRNATAYGYWNKNADSTRCCSETMYQGHPAVREGLLYGDNFKTYDRLPEDTVRRANYTDTADTGEDYLCSVCYEVGARRYRLHYRRGLFAARHGGDGDPGSRHAATPTAPSQPASKATTAAADSPAK